MSKLTAAQRKRIEPKDFAGPDKSYPIEDKSHARNALARVSQHGSSELKAKVRAKVEAKYPSIKVGGEGEKAKSRKDRPERCAGGEVKRADGGSTSPKRANEDAARVTRQILEQRGLVTPARAKGGKVKLDAGAGSGVDRLEQAEAAKCRADGGGVESDVADALATAKYLNEKDGD